MTGVINTSSVNNHARYGMTRLEGIRTRKDVCKLKACEPMGPGQKPGLLFYPTTCEHEATTLSFRNVHMDYERKAHQPSNERQYYRLLWGGTWNFAMLIAYLPEQKPI